MKIFSSKSIVIFLKCNPHWSSSTAWDCGSLTLGVILHTSGPNFRWQFEKWNYTGCMGSNFVITQKSHLVTLISGSLTKIYPSYPKEQWNTSHTKILWKSTMVTLSTLHFSKNPIFTAIFKCHIIFDHDPSATRYSSSLS